MPGDLQSLRVNVTYRTIPCESTKNVTRPSERPIKPRGTLYALRPSPDSSLNIGYCHSLSGGAKNVRGAEEGRFTYGHIVFGSKGFDSRDRVWGDPNDRDTGVLELNFL